MAKVTNGVEILPKISTVSLRSLIKSKRKKRRPKCGNNLTEWRYNLALRKYWQIYGQRREKSPHQW